MAEIGLRMPPASAPTTIPLVDYENGNYNYYNGGGQGGGGSALGTDDRLLNFVFISIIE